MIKLKMICINNSYLNCDNYMIQLEGNSIGFENNMERYYFYLKEKILEILPQMPLMY